MSKLMKRVCSARALLVLGALLTPVAASAFTVSPENQSNSFPYIVGNVAVASNSVVLPMGHFFAVYTNGNDYILGRTTGFSVRINLSNGAQFTGTPLVEPVSNLTALQTCTPGCTKGSGWSVTQSAGGAGQSYVVYSFQPSVAGATIGTGRLLWLYDPNGEQDDPQITNAGTLGTPGGSVAVTTTLVDPNTAQPIETPVTINLVTSIDPITFNINPFGVPVGAGAGDYIDVGSNASIASKTWFGNASIGSLLSGTYGAGILSSGINSAIYNKAAYPQGFLISAAKDQYGLTVTGNFAAFTQPGAMVYLDHAGTCRTVPAAGSPLLATVTPTSAAFTGFTAADLGNAGYPYAIKSVIPGTIAAGTAWTAALCFSVPNGNSIVIPPSQYTAQLSFTGGGASAGGAFTFPFAFAGASNTEPTQPLLTMNYNGPVVTVATVNPAGNTTEQSFLRINNTGSLGGLVTITGVDDAGHVASGQVSFMLPANHSIDLNSTVLQSGTSTPINGIVVNGALGTPVGKWVLTVTGQFQGMVVTSLNRNNSTGTVSDLTPAESGHVLPLGTGPAGQ